MVRARQSADNALSGEPSHDPPPLHDEADYLNLVEIPLNMWVDTFRLTLDNQEVSREDMFD